MSATKSLEPTRRKPRSRFLRLWWVWLIVVAIAVAAAVCVWQLADRALAVKAELESAQAKSSQLREQATALDIENARVTLDDIKAHTQRAVELTDDPLWNAAESVPFVGVNLSAVREIGEVTDSVMTDVATPLLDVAASIDPTTFAPKDGAINIPPIVDAIPAVQAVDVSIAANLGSINAVDTDGAVAQVVNAKKQVGELLESVQPIMSTLNTTLPLLPPALGSEAPRKYVVMFQNNAEARALGGTALSFAVLNITQGRIEFQETIPAGFRNFVSNASAIPVPDGVSNLYGNGYATFIANATLRPSFTDAAKITQEMWIQDQGYPVDGIISIDPVALSYVLRATGPIPLSKGDVLTSDSLVPLLLNGAYERFDSGNVVLDNIRQDVLYAETVDATFSALTTGPLDAPALLSALSQGWDERRILYWSAHEEEQAKLAEVGLNGEMPVSDGSTERVGLYFQDNVGSKLNYFLNQSVMLAQGNCRADGLESYRVSADLTSSVDPAAVRTLSPSISGQYKREGLKPGVQRMIVYLYAPPGSQITGATVNGAAVTLEPHHDTNYPVGKLVVSVDPGATVSLSYDLVAASAGSRTLEAQITPMVNPTTVTTAQLDCATVAAG